METKEIADKLVEYCQTNQWERAYRELFAENARGIEAKESPMFPIETIGRDAMIEKGKKFTEQVEKVHSYEISEPLVAGSFFTLKTSMTADFKGAGNVHMEEICLYRTENGKIISEQFFYD